MAVLTTAQRKQELEDWQRDASAARDEIGLNKAQLRTVLNTLDDNLEDHWPDLLDGIPPAARTKLGNALLLDLLMIVVRRRAKKLGKKGR